MINFVKFNVRMKCECMRAYTRECINYVYVYEGGEVHSCASVLACLCLFVCCVCCCLSICATLTFSNCVCERLSVCLSVRLSTSLLAYVLSVCLISCLSDLAVSLYRLFFNFIFYHLARACHAHARAHRDFQGLDNSFSTAILAALSDVKWTPGEPSKTEEQASGPISIINIV